MRFRSQSRAELAIRILLFVGVAIAITGAVIVLEHGALGLGLLVVGLAVAMSFCWIEGPAAASGPSDERKPKERSETS